MFVLINGKYWNTDQIIYVDSEIKLGTTTVKINEPTRLGDRPEKEYSFQVHFSGHTLPITLRTADGYNSYEEYLNAKLEISTWHEDILKAILPEKNY